MAFSKLSSSSSRLVSRLLTLVAALGSGGAFTAAWWYRPVLLPGASNKISGSSSSNSDNNSSSGRSNSSSSSSSSSSSNSNSCNTSNNNVNSSSINDNSNALENMMRERHRLAGESKIAKVPALNNALEPPNIFYDIASHIVVFAVVNVSRLVHMIFRGKIDVQLDENYYNFLLKLKYRQEGRALITVSNHRSLLDDPTLLGCMIPYFTIIQPKHARYTLCASDYCFRPEIGGLIHGLLEAGHTFPLQRGAGIDQYHLLNFARHVAAGDWCHVFPEGGIWQLNELGGRLNDSNKTLGKLKWGVGKLIAHAPKPPIVLPFFHIGIETTLPQDPIIKLCKSLIPNSNHRVDIMFGEELSFDDLIEDHERQYGKLWKYAPKTVDDNNMEQELILWKSRDSDKILYSKITFRIQRALEHLNQEMDRLREKKYASDDFEQKRLRKIETDILKMKQKSEHDLSNKDRGRDTS